MSGKSYVNWSSQLELGFPEIDSQHKGLIDLINDLWQGLTSRGATSDLLIILAQLEDYTVRHFSDEEALMARNAYPGLAGHKASHAAFVQQLAVFHAKLEKGQTIGLDLLRFLADWLTYHISMVDRQYAQFIAAHTSAP